MHHQRIFIALILCLATASLAQDATITLAAPKVTTLPFYASLGQYSPSQTLSLGTTQQVIAVNVTLQSSYAQGSLNLCAYFNQDSSQLACQNLTNTNFQSEIITLPVRTTTANSITFVLQGFTSYTSYASTSLQSVTVTGGTPKALTQPKSSLATIADLGTVRNLIDVTGGFTGPVSVTTSDPHVVAWFNNPNAPNPTSKTVTQNYNEELMACLNDDLNIDANGNPVCDATDRANCAALGGDYYKSACCGTGAYNSCMFFSDKQALCGKDASSRWKWAPLDSTGIVLSLTGCPGVQLVSDGSRYLSCSDPPASNANIIKFQGQTTIGAHDYACQGTSIIECGGENPLSSNARRTGAFLNISGTMNYCTSNGHWKKSLDGTDRLSCNAAGFHWTGTKCCGELDDTLRSYQETYSASTNAEAGGCINNQFVATGSTLAQSQAIINYLGNFVLCGPANATVNLSAVLPLGITVQTIQPCGIPLLGGFLSGTQNNLLCTPQGTWQFTSRSDVHLAKQIPWNDPGRPKTGCCPQDQCWDGIGCRSRGEYYISGARGYQCQ